MVFSPSKEGFQFWKQKETEWGKVWGIRGCGKTVTFSPSKMPKQLQRYEQGYCA